MAACATAAHGAGPLRTAVYEPNLAAGSVGAMELARIRAAGASIVRIQVEWESIAPAAATGLSEPSDPEDPGYRWTDLDAQVQTAARNSLQPVLSVVGVPAWAKSPDAGGASHPQLDALAAFAHAIAARYGGSVQGLPRVRYWQLWNEPNLNLYLQPQFSGTEPVSPGIYRAMANTFARAVKAVSPTNVVIIGGLAPYGIQRKGQPIDKVLSVAPLTFMRDLLCVPAPGQSRAPCRAKTTFDAFSVHPYTWGGPTHTAFSADDVAIGDLPEVKQVLAQAWRLRRVTARSAPQLWVTEFSWDTNPPDPKALPVAIQARWTAEALYRMWVDGVSVITWFLLRDEPSSTPFQSGLYFSGPNVRADRPKPTLVAFRFPFVAYRRGGGAYVWGRVPDSAAHPVAIEQRAGSRWRRVALLRSGRAGLFAGVVPLRSSDDLRAHAVGTSSTSLAFSLTPVPDRRVSPFGG